jgi:microcystin-dependent protein
MEEYIIGQIIIFAGKSAPNGWMFCDGQLLNPKAYTYEKLFRVIGKTYGGDGQTTFALPDLRGAAVVHPKSQGLLGTKGGDAEKNFSPGHFPLHHHTTVNATVKSSSMVGNQNSPVNNYPANSGRDSEYHQTSSETSMAANSVYITEVLNEGSPKLAPLSNMQPYLAVNFMIKVS